MKLLLDSHVALWWFAASSLLGASTREAIQDARKVYISVASGWEIAIKRALGKLDAPADLERAIAVSGFQVLPIDLRHALTAGELPPHHGDPFDRMLVAQAQLEGLVLVTRDRYIPKYDVRVLAA